MIRHDRLDAAASTTMLVLTVIWGVNQVAIKLANAGISPAFQSGLRSLGALGCLVLWCRLRNVPLLVRDGTLWPGVLVGALFGLEFALIYWSLVFTDVARSVIYLYTAPFWVALGAHLFIPGERLRSIQVIGLAAAFGGLVLAAYDGLSLPDPRALFGDTLMLAAAFFWGATTVLIKTTSLADIAPERVLGYQLAVSGAMLVAGAPLAGEALIHAPTATVLGAFAFQVVVVAFASYLVWFALIRTYPASILSAFTFLTPLFGMAAGWAFLDERMSVTLAASLVLVAVGIRLVNRPRGAERQD